MKRVFSLLLALVLTLGLCACGDSSAKWQEQYDLGEHYLTDGSYEEAILAFRAAIEIDPRRPEPYLLLSEVYLGGDDYDAAVAILRQGAEAIPDSEELRTRLDRLLNGWSEIDTEADGGRIVTDYDGRGRVLRIRCYDPDGFLFQEDAYGDAQGQWLAIQKRLYGRDGVDTTIYPSYDSRGRETRADWYQDGNLVYYDLTSYGGGERSTRVDRYDAGGELLYYWFPQYDADGGWVEDVSYYPDGTRME